MKTHLLVYCQGEAGEDGLRGESGAPGKFVSVLSIKRVVIEVLEILYRVILALLESLGQVERTVPLYANNHKGEKILILPSYRDLLESQVNQDLLVQQ